jgi:hypothetical protein
MLPAVWCLVLAVFTAAANAWIAVRGAPGSSRRLGWSASLAFVAAGCFLPNSSAPIWVVGFIAGAVTGATRGWTISIKVESSSILSNAGSAVPSSRRPGDTIWLAIALLVLSLITLAAHLARWGWPIGQMEIAGLATLVAGAIFGRSSALLGRM